MTQNTNTQDKKWYEGAVVYQIYPRSFQDSNADGVGDLAGIIQRLDYLNDGAGGGLGVTAIWLSPFYPSPMIDFGYDVADYCDVDPLFGDIQTFDVLLAEAHKRGIKLIVDLVPNHTSDQHAWFQEARGARTSPKRDWYIWRDAKPDGALPNNWVSVFGGPAWTLDEQTGQYYLHSFLPSQPDLNWENPEVRGAIDAVMRFWLDKGVDGFRVDAINLMGKDASLRDDPVNPNFTGKLLAYDAVDHVYSRDAGNYYQYLESLAKTTDDYPEAALFFETWMIERDHPGQYIDFCKALARKSCIPFNFELMLGEEHWHPANIQRILDTFSLNMPEISQPVYVLGNHDQPRLASRVGTKDERVAAMMLHTLPGMSFMYYGDEIGMENVNIPANRVQDPAEKRVPGTGRDTSRTPMQWSDEVFAGFSTAETWLPIAPDLSKISVAAQQDDAASLLQLNKDLIRLRLSNEILRYGGYISTKHEHDDVVSYIRELNDDRLLVLLNFGAEQISLGVLPEDATLVYSTVRGRQDLADGLLGPNEGVVITV